MRANTYGVALFVAILSLGVGRARAQEDATKSRLDELEKKLEEQARELEALKRNAAKEAAKAPPKDPSKEAAAGGKSPTFEWGYDDGFFVKGDVNGSPYEVRPRALIQLDYRFHPHAGANRAFPHSVPQDQFIVPRARVGLSGRFSVFKFEILADPVKPFIPLADAWIQWSQFDEVQVRVGHYAIPFGPSAGVCIEGPMILAVATAGFQANPSYLPGAEVLGEVAGGLFRYWVSAQNIVDSNSVLTGDPLLFARAESSFAGATVGAAGIWARHGGRNQNSFTFVTPGLHQFFDPVNVRGWDQRFEVDASYNAGPFYANTSYVYAQQERRRAGTGGADGTPLVSQGASLTLAWLFWGPTPSSTRPHGLPFAGWELFNVDAQNDKAKRRTGAELVCRVEWIDVRDARGGKSFVNGVAISEGNAAESINVKGNQAWAVTGGLNLYLQENVTLMFNYVHSRTGDLARAEKAHTRHADEFLLRAQLEF